VPKTLKGKGKKCEQHPKKPPKTGYLWVCWEVGPQFAQASVFKLTSKKMRTWVKTALGGNRPSMCTGFDKRNEKKG